MITGKVSNILSENIPVALSVLAPNGDQVMLDQLHVGLDGKFSTEFTVGGPLMRSGETYTVKASYGGDATSLAKTIFEYSLN